MLGHKSAAMTLDRYADLFEDDLASVADRLNERVLKESNGVRGRAGPNCRPRHNRAHEKPTWLTSQRRMFLDNIDGPIWTST